MYWTLVDGVRKQRDHDAVDGRGGYVPGTPRTMERLPRRVMQVPEARLADRRAVGDGQAVVRVVGAVAEAVDAEVAGVRLAIMHDQAGTVIGGMTDVRRP